MISRKETVAKGIRILSVPPVMITALVLALAALRPDMFRSGTEIVVTIVLLGFVPVLAYPVHKAVPALRGKGREEQRKLAFVFNLAGYTAAFMWALIEDVSSELVLICATYFGSVVLLTISNKLIHFRASGHASSFTGPLLLAVYLTGTKLVIPCVLIAGLVIWSSLTLKRHTIKELAGGIVICTVSFLVSLFGVSL